MAKKKKTKKGGSRRRKGMGSVSSSDKMKRALSMLSGVVAANLTHEGLAWLGTQPFMAPAADSTSKFNIKQVGLDAGLLLASGAGAILIKNEYVSGALGGVAIASSMFLKEDLVKPALGLGGLGAVEDYLELYKSKDALKDLNGTKSDEGKKRVALAGDSPIRL